MPITGVARRRACTLVTTTALTAGLFTAVAIDPAGAAPSAVEVGAVADQLVDKDGTTLWLAGTKGVGHGTGTSARTKVSGISSAKSLAQSPDGTVYAASSDSLFAIDRTSFAVSTVSTGGYGCLGDVAVTADAVWVVSSCDNAGTATDARVVEITGATVTPDAVVIDQPGAVRLAATASELVVTDHVEATFTDLETGEQGEYVSPRFRVFDVASGGVLTQKSQHNFGNDQGTPYVELNHSGSRLVAGSDMSFASYDTATGERKTDMQSGLGDPVAVAFSADDRFVALARDGAYRQIDVVDDVTGRVLRRHTFPTSPVSVSWFGRSLAVVGRDAGGDHFGSIVQAQREDVLTYLEAQNGTLYWDHKMTINGSVGSEAGQDVSGLQLVVSRDGTGGRHALSTVTTSSNGSFKIVDGPSVAGHYTYTVTRAADDRFEAISISTKRTVSHHSSGLKITTDHSRYVAGQTALVTATLPRHYTNRTVALYAQGGGQSRVLLRRGPVNSRGKISVRIYIPWNATLTASYGGDARYSSAAVKVTRSAKARIDTALSKPARKSGSYYVYKAKKGSSFYAAVRPAQKGAAVHFVLQRYTHKHWRNYLYGDVKQTKDGYAGIRYAGKPGVKYRERAYVDNGRYALANTSGWRYLTFTK